MSMSHLKECLVDDSYCCVCCGLTSGNLKYKKKKEKNKKKEKKRKIGNIVKSAGDTWHIAKGTAVKKGCHEVEKNFKKVKV